MIPLETEAKVLRIRHLLLLWSILKSRFFQVGRRKIKKINAVISGSRYFRARGWGVTFRILRYCVTRYLAVQNPGIYIVLLIQSAFICLHEGL